MWGELLGGLVVVRGRCGAECCGVDGCGVEGLQCGVVVFIDCGVVKVAL